MAKDETSVVVPSVQMPSADLINYRFDQTDKNIAALTELVTSLTATFATKEELGVLVRRVDNFVWYWRALVTALLLALAGAIVNLIRGVK